MNPNLPTQRRIIGLALKPTTVANSPEITGETIAAPWKLGRWLTFSIIAGAMTTSDALTCKVQARRKGTSTWDDVKAYGTTDVLAFTAAKTADAGELDEGIVSGAIDLTRLTTGEFVNDAGSTVHKNLPPVSGTQYEYDALRLNVVNGVAQNVVVGAIYEIDECYVLPTDQVDDLFFKQTVYNEND